MALRGGASKDGNLLPSSLSLICSQSQIKWMLIQLARLRARVHLFGRLLQKLLPFYSYRGRLALPSCVKSG